MDPRIYGPSSIATCKGWRGQGINAHAPPLDPLVLKDLGYFRKELIRLSTKWMDTPFWQLDSLSFLNLAHEIQPFEASDSHDSETLDNYYFLHRFSRSGLHEPSYGSCEIILDFSQISG